MGFVVSWQTGPAWSRQCERCGSSGYKLIVAEQGLDFRCKNCGYEIAPCEGGPASTYTWQAVESLRKISAAVFSGQANIQIVDASNTSLTKEEVVAWIKKLEGRRQEEDEEPTPKIHFVCPDCGGTKLVHDINGLFMYTLKEFEKPIRHLSGKCWVGDKLVYDENLREEIPEDQRFRNPIREDPAVIWEDFGFDPDEDEDDLESFERMEEEFSWEFTVFRCGNPDCTSGPLSFENQNSTRICGKIGEPLFQPRHLYDWLLDHGMLENHVEEIR